MLLFCGQGSVASQQHLFTILAAVVDAKCTHVNLSMPAQHMSRVAHLSGRPATPGQRCSAWGRPRSATDTFTAMFATCAHTASTSGRCRHKKACRHWSNERRTQASSTHSTMANEDSSKMARIIGQKSARQSVKLASIYTRSITFGVPNMCIPRHLHADTRTAGFDRALRPTWCADAFALPLTCTTGRSCCLLAVRCPSLPFANEALNRCLNSSLLVHVTQSMSTFLAVCCRSCQLQEAAAGSGGH